MKSCYYRKLCSLWTHVKRPLNINGCPAAARFNNIFLKLFDRHATYCYLQVDLKSFLASGATEPATISQVINSRHS